MNGNRLQMVIGFKYRQSEKSRNPFDLGGGAQALSSGCHDSAVAYGINPVMSGVMMETKPAEETAQTLRKSPGGENGVVQTVGFKAGQSKNGGLGDTRCGSFDPFANGTIPGGGMTESVAQSFVNGNCPGHHNCIALDCDKLKSVKTSACARTWWNGDDVAPTTITGQNLQAVLASLSQMRYIVRRLTPTEAERLMGLPDSYTIPTGLRHFFGADGEPAPELVSEFVDIFDKFNAIMADYAHKKPPKGKSYNQVATWLKKISDPATCPDSPRYKGCGNGWATNQPRWILMRLLHFTGQEGGAK